MAEPTVSFFLKGVTMFTKNMTIGEKYGPAMEIQTKEKAKKYFELCVVHTLDVNKKLSREEAINIEKSNLGYYAGYYDSETRIRVEKLFGCQHPIFGPISQGEPTPKEAVDAGQVFGATGDATKAREFFQKEKL